LGSARFLRVAGAFGVPMESGDTPPHFWWIAAL
jgi:hypothetical protein